MRAYSLKQKVFMAKRDGKKEVVLTMEEAELALQAMKALDQCISNFFAPVEYEGEWPEGFKPPAQNPYVAGSARRVQQGNRGGSQMRAYFFVNSALSGIQKGLQVAHCVTEMGNKAAAVASWIHDQAARDADPEKIALHDTYFDWAEHAKTMIVLEGGFHAGLQEISNFFAPVEYEGEWPEGFKPPAQNPYLWAEFYEDEETMNGMMTCVGIILPERIYEAAAHLREYPGNSMA